MMGFESGAIVVVGSNGRFNSFLFPEDKDSCSQFSLYFLSSLSSVTAVRLFEI